MTIVRNFESAPIRLELDAVYQVRDFAIAVPAYGGDMHQPATVPGYITPDIIAGSVRSPGGLATVITADGAAIGGPLAQIVR